jgi:hypothetical protein
MGGKTAECVIGRSSWISKKVVREDYSGVFWQMQVLLGFGD